MIIPVGYAHVLVGWSGGGLPHGGATTFGIAVSGISAPSDVAGLVIGALNTSGVVDLCQAGVQTEVVRVKFGPNDTGAFYEEPYVNAGAGTLSTVSPQIALLVRKTSFMGGHRGRGRLYWPGLADEKVEGNGKIEATFLATAQTAFNTLHSALETSNIPMHLLHSEGKPDPDTGQPAPPPPAPTPVLNLIVDDTCATQRRRVRR